jgi:class 3 adenylate cyclase
MPLVDDLKETTTDFFEENYNSTSTKIIPSTDYSKLTFGNSGLVSDITFLFIDIRKSSQLVSRYGVEVAAKIYKSFHDINVRIINKRNGQVRSFDGDRIMGVFSGDRKNNNAVEAAMNIRWAIANILNSHLPTNSPINIGIGIDTGETLITKVGRGHNSSNNDLVWIGEACNYASHMCNESQNKIYISPSVYNVLIDSNITVNAVNMWQSVYMTLKNGNRVLCYQTNYWWENM